MVKVIDPAEGVIVGVYENESDVPERIPNRFESYWFKKKECEIVEVTDPNEQKNSRNP